MEHRWCGPKTSRPVNQSSLQKRLCQPPTPAAPSVLTGVPWAGLLPCALPGSGPGGTSADQVHPTLEFPCLGHAGHGPGPTEPEDAEIPAPRPSFRGLSSCRPGSGQQGAPGQRGTWKANWEHWPVQPGPGGHLASGGSAPGRARQTPSPTPRPNRGDCTRGASRPRGRSPPLLRQTWQ